MARGFNNTKNEYLELRFRVSRSGLRQRDMRAWTSVMGAGCPSAPIWNARPRRADPASGRWLRCGCVWCHGLGPLRGRVGGLGRCRFVAAVRFSARNKKPVATLEDDSGERRSGRRVVTRCISHISSPVNPSRVARLVGLHRPPAETSTTAVLRQLRCILSAPSCPKSTRCLVQLWSGALWHEVAGAFVHLQCRSGYRLANTFSDRCREKPVIRSQRINVGAAIRGSVSLTTW